MVFQDRKFIVVRNNVDKEEKYEALVSLLKAHGGEIVAWEERADGDVSPKLIIIASSVDYERAEEMRRFMIPTVTDAWVHACIHENKLVPMRPYSPDPRNFMRDVIACFSNLSSGDTDVFKAGILASGGECSDIVTRYTSHVVATDLSNAECELVLQSKKNNPSINIRLVRPEWIDACMSLKVKVDDTPYLLTNDPKDDSQPSHQTQDLTGTFPVKDSPRLAVQQSMREGLGSDILEGRRFFLGHDLDLSERVAKTVDYLIELNGGLITGDLKQAQVYIGKWREGEQYIQASKQKIVVGNITWLYWVMIHRKFEKPNHLLHYPEVRGGLPAMRDFKICITNYTGDARAYLQSLIVSLGATYSGKLIENHSTHLITAYESGQKYEAAKRWGIPVVNHLWLEDSYAYWQAQDPTSRLYTYFSPKLSMSTLIGTRNLVANVLNKFQKPEELNSAREHHAKRLAKQRAGNWLHDAMIVEKEFHNNLRRGKVFPEDEDAAKKSNDAKGDEPSDSHVDDTRDDAPTAVKRTDPEHGNANANGSVNNKSEESTPKKRKTSSNSSSAQASPASAASTSVPPTNTATIQPVPTSQDANRRIMFSGVDDPPSNRACTQLGLHMAKAIPVQILVAPRVMKTVKFLQCLACADEFLKPSWIEACQKQGVLVPTDRYRIQDPQLSQALSNRAKLEGNGLFEGLVFRLDPSVKEKAPVFRDLVKAHRGQIQGPRLVKESSQLKIVGNDADQIPFDRFIESIQNMDASLLDP